MTINWETVEGAIAGLTDADALKAKLNQLKGAAEQADRRIAELKGRYETADKLRAEAAAVLVKAQEKEAGLVRREAAIAPREKELDSRAKQLDERENAVARRERAAEQRHAHLTEIARTAAV